MIEPRSAHLSQVLAGQRILVTRARVQSARLTEALAEHGAEPVLMPLIEFQSFPCTPEMEHLISRLREYDWIIFTSTNSVRVFVEKMSECGHSIATLEDIGVVAVGPATSAALRDNGITPKLVPGEYHGDALLKAMIDAGVDGTRVLLPRALVARDAFPDGLRNAGATVDVLPIYRTASPRPDPVIVSMLRRGEIDIITLTSSSTVRALIQALNGDLAPLARVRLASIGPQTSQTIREFDLEPWVVAAEHTIPGLVDAIVEAQEAQQ